MKIWVDDKWPVELTAKGTGRRVRFNFPDGQQVTLEGSMFFLETNNEDLG